MNYFEIFNKVLLELNLRAVQTFESIYKSEHLKILDAINRVNSEVLASFEWPFLERATLLDVTDDVNVYQLPFSGIIKSVYEGRKRIRYTPKAHELLVGNISGDFYSVSCGKIIFPPRKNGCNSACDGGNRLYSIHYYTKNYAAGEDGTFKPRLEKANDISILPMPYAEQILVYGACLKTKANPAYSKFGFWNTMYIQALANLKQKSSQTIECEPVIKLN